MIRHTTNATTRTRTRRRSARSVKPLLRRGDELASAETALRYRIDRLIGQGGFGQVYTARRLGRSRTVPDTLCVKVSRRIDAWIREAYFGQLLADHPRAIAIYDAFVVTRRRRHAALLPRARVCAPGRPQRATCSAPAASGRRRIARREIAGILQVLGKLHRGQLLHRDLTPLNVFVCDNTRLKLGDFGIVRQQNDKRGITARTLNPLMAPSDIFAGAAPKWQARDDVYQVGQLLGMLIKGDASARVRAPEVRKLPCSDHLKEIIYRCIGERRKRYESADELIEALSHPPAALKSGALRTAERRAPRLHRHLLEAAARCGKGRQARRRDGARHAVDQDHRRRPRQAQRAAGGRPRRRPQADGDQAAARKGPPHHDHQRAAVLAAHREITPAGNLSLTRAPSISFNMSTIDMSKPKADLPYGTLDLLILKTLDTMGALHGYSIARRIEQMSGSLKLSQGSIYPALMRLEQQGWISTKWGVSETNRKVKIYSLTRAGAKQLHVEVANWEQAAALVARILDAKA